MSGPFKTRHLRVPGRHNETYDVLIVDCVPTFTERIVPPTDEAHAFHVQHYRRHVEISVSPTGRRVRVWVDGKEAK